MSRLSKILRHTRDIRVIFAFLFFLDVLKHILVLSTGPTVLCADAAEYWNVAGVIASGDWLQIQYPVDYRTPLYPTFLGILRWLLSDHAMLTAAIIQHVLVLATSLLTAVICYRISGSSVAALLAYALSILCITRAWFANVLLTESHFTLLLTASIGALAEYHRRPCVKWSGLLAFLLGATVLIRPVPQLLWIPLFSLFLLRKSTSGSMQRKLFHWGVAVIILQSMMVPWSVRNWLIFDQYFLTRLPAVNKWQVCFQGGAAPLLPIPENEAGRRIAIAFPTVVTEDDSSRYSYAVVAELARAGYSPDEIDNLVTETCVAAISEHPQRFAWSTFRRFVNYWRCCVQEYPFYSRYDDAAGAHDGKSISWRNDRIAEVAEWIIPRPLSRLLWWNELVSVSTAFGVIVLSTSLKTRWLGVSLGLAFLYFAAITACVEIENYRYRMVLEPCMILAVCAGAANLCLLRQGSRQENC